MTADAGKMTLKADTDIDTDMEIGTQDCSSDMALPPCRLEERDLRELVRLVAADLPPDRPAEWLRITTEVPNHQVHSVDDLRQNPHLPAVVTYLIVDTLAARGQQVLLHVSPATSRLRVWGTDDTSVHHTAAAIATFVRTKRPWYWAVPWLLHQPNAAVLLTACTLLGLGGLALTLTIPRLDPALGLLAGAAAVAGVLALVGRQRIPYGWTTLRSDTSQV